MFKIITEGCEPTKGSKYSAAIDLRAAEDVVIGAGETKIIGLGVCIDIDTLKEIIINKSGILNPFYVYSKSKEEISEEYFESFKYSHFLQLEPRSSLRAEGLIAGTGIIDLDYKDEIKIILHNLVDNVISSSEGGHSFMGDCIYIGKGDRIAQIMLKEHESYLMGIETEDERKGGLGSTGQ